MANSKQSKPTADKRPYCDTKLPHLLLKGNNPNDTQNCYQKCLILGRA